MTTARLISLFTATAGEPEITLEGGLAALGAEPHMMAGYQQLRGEPYYPKLALVSAPFDDGTVTVSPALLPWTTPPVFDTKELAVRWAESGDGAANLVILQAEFSTPDSDVQWFVADGAPTPEEFVLPELPAEYDAYLPTPGSEATATLLLMHVDSAKRELARKNALYMACGGVLNLYPAEGGHTSISGEFGT